MTASDGNPAVVPTLDVRAYPKVMATVCRADLWDMAQHAVVLPPGPLHLHRESHLPPHLKTTAAGPLDFRDARPAPLPADPLAVTPEAVTAYRAWRGWSQPAMAAAVGVSQSVISAWELGRRMPSLPALRKLYATMPGACGDD